MNTCLMKYKWPLKTYSISVAVRKICINQTTLRSYLTAFRIIINTTKQDPANVGKDVEGTNPYTLLAVI